jgi:isoleucyl-tRNA synthetase
LSNWFVRRSRERFWASDRQDRDKLDAYWTLYEVLLETTKLIAPFVPFLAETLWRELTRPFATATDSSPNAAKPNAASPTTAQSQGVPDSVHLCDYPVPSEANRNPDLAGSMRVLREIASLGRAARAAAKLKVRQPLSRVEVVLRDDRYTAWLSQHDALVCDELNVKAVDYTTDGQAYVEYVVVPNFKRLGPRVGRQMPAVKKALGDADGGKLLEEMQQHGKITLQVGGETLELDGEDVEVRLAAREGWTAAQGRDCVVVLSTEVTAELRLEGIAKDAIRMIQNRRKDLQCEFTDRIEIGLVSSESEVTEALEAHRQRIIDETLADVCGFDALPAAEGVTVKLGDYEAELFVRTVAKPPV